MTRLFLLPIRRTTKISFDYSKADDQEEIRHTTKICFDYSKADDQALPPTY